MSDKTEIQQTCNQPESNLTIKWGMVIVLILGFVGWVVLGALGHESRITKIETKLEIHLPLITQNLDDLKTLTKEIRDDQKRLERAARQ